MADRYVEAIRQWADANANVLALALVGSHARNQARADSDIDLVLLCGDRSLLLDDTSWVGRFGYAVSCVREEWDAVTSLRVNYADGQEIEFGLAPGSWAGIPVDAGTRRVVSDGMVILKDTGNMLRNLKTEN